MIKILESGKEPATIVNKGATESLMLMQNIEFISFFCFLLLKIYL